MTSDASPAVGRVLLLPLTTRDGEAMSALLEANEIAFAVASSMPALCDLIGDDTGTVVVSEETLATEADQLVACVRDQPVWSDLPVIVLSKSGPESSPLTRALAALGNVSVLERPVRVTTLLSVVRSTLRGRARQYEVREQLAELRRASQALRESQERFAFSVEAAELGTFYCPMPLGKIEWNDKCKEHFFLPPNADVDFDRFYSIIHPEDRERTRQAVEHAVFDHNSYDIEYRTVASDGRTRWVRAKGRAYYDAGGSPMRFDGVTLDITKQKEAEAERQALLNRETVARTEAERASRIKDEFLATLSHELRTPLNAIVGWSQIIRASPGRAEDVAEGIEVIERNARSQTQIIEDLLDMSRIINGNLRLDVQRVQLAVVLREVAKTVAPAAEAKGIRVQLVLDPLAGPVSGDPNRLQQVFWNLLSNSIKFSPKGARVQVLLERINSHLEVSVIDTGDGIDPAFLPHVFDRFRQADPTTTRRHGGLGLGLAIVKQLVELHGGTIRAKSPGKGQGSTFIVALPLTVVHPESEPQPERRHPNAQLMPTVVDTCVKIAGAHVLVVDDEPDARNLLRRLLEECDAKVSTAATAGEAIALLQSERPDVVVSDIGMPGEDGYALIRRIRALPAGAGGRTPAIALTAYARSEDRVKAVTAGFQHHLSKPVEPAELIAMVASVLDGVRRSGG